MKQSLKLTDILGLGFMLFAFFLGAGNIIFPPLAGQLAGDHYTLAMFGFLLTAVGMPLLAIIATAYAGGSWAKLTQDLPPKIAILFAVLIYIIIGPAFAAPRTGLVAYEMGVKPFIEAPSALHLVIFSVVFFGIAIFFALYQGKLLDLIGKILTPILFISLALLSIMVVFNPQGVIEAAQGEYVSKAVAKGFIEGYNTMDSLAALMFGMLIIEAIRGKGIEDKKVQTKYLIYAALIAAAGLAFVYISLFYLGATSSTIAIGADNGGAILTVYVQALFGDGGQFVLSTIMLLACLTTAIGLISACSEYFSSLTSISYKKWVFILGLICGLVANVGLNQLIALSVPVLYALYPVAIATILLAFIRPYFSNPRLAYRCVLTVSLLFALIDAGKAMEFEMSAFSGLPLFDFGMAWLLPTLVMMIAMLFVRQPQMRNA